MPLSFLPVLILACCTTPFDLGAREIKVPPPSLPEFLKRYSQGLQPLDKLYLELKDEDFSMLDELGQPLARRRIEDRQKALDELRKSVQELASAPQDLVLAIRLFLQSESLADDLFDLSQIAYDNNREELGKRLADLVSTTDHHNGLLEAYVLDLAAGMQERLRILEYENEELRKKLRDAGEKPRAKTSRLTAGAGSHGPTL